VPEETRTSTPWRRVAVRALRCQRLRPQVVEKIGEVDDAALRNGPVEQEEQVVAGAPAVLVTVGGLQSADVAVDAAQSPKLAPAKDVHRHRAIGELMAMTDRPISPIQPPSAPSAGQRHRSEKPIRPLRQRCSRPTLRLVHRHGRLRAAPAAAGRSWSRTPPSMSAAALPGSRNIRAAIGCSEGSVPGSAPASISPLRWQAARCPVRLLRSRSGSSWAHRSILSGQ
jgi:hypothetical protein